jgi:hypothetical protein
MRSHWKHTSITTSSTSSSTTSSSAAELTFPALVPALQQPEEADASPGLFKVAAHCVRAGLLALPDLLEWLSPGLAGLVAQHSAAQEALAAAVEKIGVVNLNQKGDGGIFQVGCVCCCCWWW